MPLIKSKSPKAFKANVETEMKANPSPEDKAQNLAIAYSVQRKAAHKPKMSEGGQITPGDTRGESSEPRTSVSTHEAHSIAEAIMHANKMKMEFEDQNDTMSSPIRPGYAEGGMVDIDSNEEEQPNGYYKQNEHEALDENMDSTMDGMKQPMDSNEKDPGDDLLESDDEDDMVSKIMKKSKKK